MTAQEGSLIKCLPKIFFEMDTDFLNVYLAREYLYWCSGFDLSPWLIPLNSLQLEIDGNIAHFPFRFWPPTVCNCVSIG